MSTTFGPTVVIDGPLPVPPKYGLLSVAQFPPEPDERWANGGEVFAYPAGLAQLHDPCSAGTFRTKEDGVATVNPVFAAFDVYLPFVCSTFSGDLADRVRVALQGVEGQAVERQLSQGIILDSNPFLADGNGTNLNSGAATSPRHALELLEDAIGGTGRAGVIHATPATVTSWADLGLTRDGQVLRTVVGTPIAVGHGYIGAVRAGAGALAGGDQAWAFATGPVHARKGEIRNLDAVDQEDNTHTYLAERAWHVAWDTQLQASVLVDRSVT